MNQIRPGSRSGAGSEGSSGIDAARGARFRLFDALRGTGDVVLLDQRGTGLSTPIAPEQCPVERTYPSDRPIELEPYLDLVTELGRACARFWADHGVDLSAYHTLESVADLEALRTALGVDRIRLVAISYGTHLALAYLRHHPDLGPDFRAPVESRVPTLFISGSLDGRTPTANAHEVLRGFPDARHLIVENGGHGDGFPFHPTSETDFYIDFPWFIDLDFQFETDDAGRITHLVFETRDGETVRMEKVH